MWSAHPTPAAGAAAVGASSIAGPGHPDHTAGGGDAGQLQAQQVGSLERVGAFGGVVQQTVEPAFAAHQLFDAAEAGLQEQVPRVCAVIFAVAFCLRCPLRQL